MIKAHNIQAVFPRLALNGNQLPGVNIVPVLRRISARIARTCHGSHPAVAVIFHSAQQYPTALVRVGFFSVAAKLVVAGLVNS
jgi:hypothetical protein